MPRSSINQHRPVASSNILLVTETKEKIEKTLSEIIAHYACQNEYVQVATIIEKLFNIYKVTKWNEMQIENVYNPYADLKPLKNFIHRQTKLYLFLEVFKQLRIIATISELTEEILTHLEIDSYEKLNFGPILKHPEIIKIFNLHDITMIRPTESIEIIEYFHDYTRHLKYNEKVDFDQFKIDAAKYFEVENWANLGIHITSFPYLLKVNIISFVFHFLIIKMNKLF